MKRFAMIACTFTFLAGCTDSGLHESDSPIDNNNVSVRMACGYNLCPEDLGKYCDSNRDCTNRQCVNHACRYESNATVGDHSSEHASDSESGGGADPGGGSGGGADSSSAHGSSSSEGLSASNLWVEGGSLPSGSACESHQACESGLCYQGRCSDDCELLGCSDSNMVCRYGRCIPISTDGGECSFKPIEADELGYKYNHFTGGGIIGCADHEFCCNGFCQKEQCEPMISCQIPGDCSSNSCYDFVDKLENIRPVCGCSFDEECGSDMYCASTRANIIRYDDKEYHHYWQYDKDEKVSICKAKLVVGGACNRDAMCALGACYDGECVMPKKAESRCDSDGDCATMTCGESNYRDGDREKWEACHADGHDCKLNTVCVDKYEDGEKCYRDENCKSGYCSEKSGVCSSR